jgi:hypothetical protein
MPLYEYYKNTENVVHLRDGSVQKTVIGTRTVAAAVCKFCSKGSVAIDGWYGVDWSALRNAIEIEAGANGTAVCFVHAYVQKRGTN